MAFFLLEWSNYDLVIKLHITQSCMVINQLEREIYVSEIVFRTSSSVKISRLLQRKKSSIQHFWIVVPYQYSNALTLELEAAVLEKVLSNVTSNLRLHSVRYLKNILCTKNPQTVDLVIFTEEILNGKLHFLCSDIESEISKLFRSTN